MNLLVEWTGNKKDRRELFPSIFNYQSVKPYEERPINRETFTDESKAFNRRIAVIDEKIELFSRLEAEAETAEQSNYYQLKISELIETILPYEPDCPAWQEQREQRQRIREQLQAYHE